MNAKRNHRRLAAFERLEPKQLLANWYVATGGNDSAAGSQAAPFASIDRAAVSARAGDTVFVRGGTYSPSAPQWIGNNGTSSARITFRPFGSETAIVDGTNCNAGGRDLIVIGGDYIDFTGFEIRNSRNHGIQLVNSTGSRITRNHVHHNRNIGIASWGDNQSAYSDLLIEGNEVNDNCAGVFPGNNAGGGWTQGIAITGGNSVTVRGNHVHHNWGEGIGFDRVGSASVIEKNDCHDDFGIEIYLMNQVGASVRGNFLHTTNDTRYYRYDAPSRGIQIATEMSGITSSRNNVVVNNISVGNACGFYYGSYIVGGGMINTLVANNTFVNSTQEAIWIDADTHSGSRVVNNIFYQNNGATYLSRVFGSAGITWDRNLWYGGGQVQDIARSSRDISSNPKFVNVTGSRPQDFKLRADSKAIDRGRPVSIKQDYSGKKRVRGSKVDLGAWEFAG